jgi:drug/metabolite transporter (DMT)-like permease
MIDPNSKSFWRKNTGKSNFKSKVLLIASILIGSGGQIFMKHGVGALGGISFQGSFVAELLKIFMNPYILLGLVCCLGGMLLWLTVISKLELSFAYPIVALSYIVILLYGIAVFHEKVSLIRIAGVASIMVGVVLTARTESGKGGG